MRSASTTCTTASHDLTEVSARVLPRRWQQASKTIVDNLEHRRTHRPNLKGEWGWSITFHPHSPRDQVGEQFLETVRSVGPTSVIPPNSSACLDRDLTQSRIQTDPLPNGKGIPDKLSETRNQLSSRPLLTCSNPS